MQTIKHETQTPVLVVGAGPAGLIAALQLATNGTPCILAERNLETTRWPKMDITNCRSMEILRRLGIADGLRDVGVPSHWSFNVLFSTGLGGTETMPKWDLPSPDGWRQRIKETNDGSMPREPYQRCSQAIFEAWLKPRIQANPLIESHFGWKLDTLTEYNDYVESEIIDQDGCRHFIKSKYVIGCDGAGSRVRRAVGIKLKGDPAPGAMWLIHFKSRNLERLRSQGQFWHIFFTTGHVLIAQNEKDTWTMHTPIEIGVSVEDLDPKEAIYKGLGAEHAPYQINIEEILVTSVWRPTICLAEKYISPGGRVFLAGDSAHQNIPTGGYGMNTAVGDSFDIGWKLSAVLKEYAGPSLLTSYEEERQPVGARNIERSGVHMNIHATYVQWCRNAPGVITSASPTGQQLRQSLAQLVHTHDGENKDHGIELGYRYNSAVIAFTEIDTHEPMWNEREFVPSTWPGSRAPHVFLHDGETSIFDLFGTGSEFTLVDFTPGARFIKIFDLILRRRGVPCKLLNLVDENHAREIWERDAVLVRPDDHVAWRSPVSITAAGDVDPDRILDVVLGLGFHEANKV
ncbi:monooxygenase [Aspergillus cavernicola]|uniref:Monooxygenase n=1 Tax=Aspergillus cavernicola TaxID=176166 RepID=A0ABR4HZL4_9EURO